MPRIMGVDIPTEKRIEISLQYLYGVGQYRAKQILKETGINPNTRARDLKDDEIARIASFIDKNYNDEVIKDGRSGPVEGALRRKVQQAILRLKKIGCYRGSRHVKGLPVRGQRTRTNARTRKGKKKTVAVKRSVKEMR
ncbi:MAG TPA: 30S ribosomal protein S13 [Planctomycetota bacterium]|nr:30S ribosomal protein S13 [Planctomycetota bacterium]